MMYSERFGQSQGLPAAPSSQETKIRAVKALEGRAVTKLWY